MRKQVFKNMDVEITSESVMQNGETKVGNGTLRRDLHKFVFEEEPPRTVKKNPIMFSGKFFRIRFTKDEVIRFTATIPKRHLKGMVSRRGRQALTKDLLSGIDKMESYV